MIFLQKPACDPISCPRPTPDVKHPAWVDSALPTATRRHPAGEHHRCIRRILRYSPSILQPHPVGILQVFSRAPQAAAGCHKGASGGRMAPQGAAGRLEPLIGANRRSLARISSNQLCLVRCKGRRQGAAGNFREFPEASCGAPPPTLALSQTQRISVITIIIISIIIINIITIMYHNKINNINDNKNN